MMKKIKLMLTIAILLSNTVWGSNRMSASYHTINFGGVNAYLIKQDSIYLLIDNGFSAKGDFLDQELRKLGCKPGNLKLVILTHGDHDHVGNSLFLREKYGARIAMHTDDSAMVTKGDMTWNRKKKADRLSLFFRTMTRVSFLFDSGDFDPFEPDLYIDENFDFSPYLPNAKIIHTPGHSKGSISVYTEDGYLFCGDLLYNFFGKPRLEFCDNLSDFSESVSKLKRLDITTFFPGHGMPFSMDQFLRKF